jgi:hypothetical protein
MEMEGRVLGRVLRAASELSCLNYDVSGSVDLVAGIVKDCISSDKDVRFRSIVNSTAVPEAASRLFRGHFRLEALSDTAWLRKLRLKVVQSMKQNISHNTDTLVVFDLAGLPLEYHRCSRRC